MLFFGKAQNITFQLKVVGPLSQKSGYELWLRIGKSDAYRYESTSIEQEVTQCSKLSKEKKEGVVERMHWLHNQLAAIWSPTEFRCRNTFLDLWCNLAGFVADQVKTDLCMEKAALSLTQCNIFSEEGSACLCLHFLALKRPFVMWALTNLINTRLWRKDGRSLQLG